MLDSLLLARNDPLSHVGGPDGRAEKHAVTVEQPLSWIAFAAGIAHEQPSPSAATDNSFARSDVAERTIELARFTKVYGQADRDVGGVELVGPGGRRVSLALSAHRLFLAAVSPSVRGTVQLRAELGGHGRQTMRGVQEIFRAGGHGCAGMGATRSRAGVVALAALIGLALSAVALAVAEATERAGPWCNDAG